MEPMDMDAYSAGCQNAESVGALQQLSIAFFTAQGVAMISYHHLPPPGAAGLRPLHGMGAWFSGKLGKAIPQKSIS